MSSIFKDIGGKISSKRIMGIILILFSMATVLFGIEYQSFLVTGASLLGVGVVENFAKK